MAEVAGRLARWTAAFDPRRWLVVYMRLLSVVFLAGGLLHWLALLSLPTDPADPLGAFAPVERVVTIVFAVLDPIVAVGLWLTSAWGAVVWLMATIARMVLNSGYAAGMPADHVLVGIHASTLLTYLVLAWLARRAADA